MDAVSAATTGDTIHIAPGTYFENVVLDQDLTLIGTGGREVTFIDGMASGSVVEVTGLDVGVTLEGITLRNGSAFYGGGLHCETLNTLGPTPETRLYDCAIEDNSATLAGGGISVSIENNVLLTRTLVAGNHSAFDGGGIAVAGMAGGIIEGPGALTMMDSTVADNTAEHAGGGIVGLGAGALLTILGSRITNNTADGFAVQGGGVWGGASVITLANSTLTNNRAVGTADAQGGAVVNSYGTLEITNSTVSGNTASGPWALGSAIIAFDGCDLTFENSILWGNGPDPLLVLNATASVHHSLLEGGWPGVGNLSTDPLFVDPVNGDYRLQAGSPCTDAGDNTAVLPGLVYDLRGAPRFIDDLVTPDTGVGPAPVVDMGAFEFFPRYRGALGVPVRPAPPRTVP